MEQQTNKYGMTLLTRATPQTGKDTTSPSLDTEETSLHGSWLVLVWIIWLIIVLGSLVFFAISFPTYFAQVQTVCTSPDCIGLAQSDIRGFQVLGISLTFYASCMVVFAVLYVLIWSGIAMVLFWRKSADRMALFMGLMPVTFAIIQANTLTPLPANLAGFNHLIRILAWICFTLFFYLFPTGQFVPRLTQLFSIATLAYWVGNEFIANTSVADSPDEILFWIDFVIFFVILVGSFFPAIRQGVVGNVISNAGFPLILLPIPISIGFAIVRSHLWDIDLIINRTLVYGILTTILVVIYTGLTI